MRVSQHNVSHCVRPAQPQVTLQSHHQWSEAECEHIYVMSHIIVMPFVFTVCYFVKISALSIISPAAGIILIGPKFSRRMFPTVRISFRNIPDGGRYLVLLDIIPCDNKRYRLVSRLAPREMTPLVSGTPITAPVGWWLASVTRPLLTASTPTLTPPSPGTSSPSRSSASRRSSSPTMKWTR